MKKLLPLSIAILLNTFFSPHLFAANVLIDYDDQKEGSNYTQPSNQVQQPKEVCNYTIIHDQNVNHTLNDIEDVEDDLRDYVSAVDVKLITTNNQSTPLLLGVVLQHKQTHEYHQYLIADTGLLSETTQPNAVKRAHKKSFHLIKATRGHVTLQLLQWLQVFKHYAVTALHTNRPVCRYCYLIVSSLWKKELPTNEKGCPSMPFPLLDNIPTFAQQYINTHLNLSLVQNFVVPMMGYVSKEEINKAIQQKDRQITMLGNELKTKDQQITALKSSLKEKDLKHQHKLNKKDNQLEEKDQQITALKFSLKEKDLKDQHKLNKKDNQLEKKDQQITALESSLKEKDVKHQHELEMKDQEIQSQAASLKIVNEQMQMLNEEVNKKEKELNSLLNVINKKNQIIVESIGKNTMANIQQVDYKKVSFQAASNPSQAKNFTNEKYLHQAIEAKNLKAINHILQKNVDLSYPNKDGQTPLHYAARHGYVAIVKILLAHNACIELTDSLEGSTALHWAVFYNHIEVAKLLLDAGADIEATVVLDTYRFKGQTALHLAALKGFEAMTKFLLKRGANKNAIVPPGAKRFVGLTPLEIAEKREKKAIVNILK